MTSPSFPERFQAMLEALSLHLASDAPVLRPDRPDTARLLEFEVDGEALALIYEPGKEPARFTIACVFGPLPDTGRDDVLTQLLQVNNAIAGTGATLSLDPFSEEVILSTTAAVDIPAGAVMHTMTSFAELAGQWRGNHFLGTSSRPDPSAAGLLA